MAGFDIARARAEGRTDDEIYDYLIKSRPKFDAQQALTEGRTKQEIIDYLSSTSAPQTGTTAGTGKTGGRLKGETKPSGFFAPMVEGEKQIEQGVGKMGTDINKSLGGLSDMFRGGLQMAYPYAAALGLSSVPAAVGVLSSIPAGAAGQYGSQALGVPEETSHAIGDVTGILGGYAGSQMPGIVSRNVTPWLSKIPYLPAKVKAGVKFFDYLMGPPKPTTPTEEYLKHGKEPEPGQWSVGLGVGPKEGMNPPPAWLNTLRSFKFEDMERKLRNQSRPPDMPPPPTDPFNTKRVGGFGTSKVSKQSPKISEMLNPEEVEPTLVDQLPEKMGPPVEPSTPPPALFDTKKVGGFGNSKVPKQNVTPTVRDMTPPPDVEPVDLPPEKGGPAPVKPKAKPESVDISGAEREAAPPPVSDAPPTFGTPEWLEQFQRLYPGLPVPEGAAPKPASPPPPPKPKAPEIKTEGALPGAVTEEDIAAELAKKKNPMENPPEKPKVTEPAAEPEKITTTEESKGEAHSIQRPAGIPDRYWEMWKTYGRDAAIRALAKDSKIAQHLIDKKITPEAWDKLSFEEQHKLAVEGHGVKRSGGLKKSWTMSREEGQSVADVRQRLVDLMQEQKGLTPPPEKSLTPPPPPAEKTTVKPPEISSQAVSVGDKGKLPSEMARQAKWDARYAAADADVARWLVDAREMSPQQWEKLSPPERDAYVTLAGKKIPADRSQEAFHGGIKKALENAWKNRGDQ